jgi:type III pantothenate kinase
MADPRNQSVLAIDVGSTSAKFGWFPAAGDCTTKPAAGLPIATPLLAMPESVLRLEHARQSARTWLDGLDMWLDELAIGDSAQCLVSSVHERAAKQLGERLQRRRRTPVVLLERRHLPIEVRTATPDRVGVDRLLGALAVNRLRSADAPAISVDMGTAVTVNLIAADGAFEGGAILPGPGTALQALHEATASLPLLTAADLPVEPPAVGKSTEEALAAGAVWGALGAIRELVARMGRQCDRTPELFLTGGGSQQFAPLIALTPGDRPARHVPHLVLAGIRVVAERLLTP